MSIWKSLFGGITKRRELDQLNEQTVELLQEGNCKQALELANKVCSLARQDLGEQDPDFALYLHNLAIAYNAMGNYEAAEPLYCQALEIQRQVLEENHPDIAFNLHDLAALYRVTGNYTAAELLYQQALEIWRKVVGEDDPKFAMSLNGLGLLYCKLGDYDASETLLKQAMEIRRKSLGESHPKFAESLLNLGQLYNARGSYDVAISLIRQALEIDRAILGKEHPGYAEDLGILASSYYKMGNYSTAELLFKQVLEIQYQVLGEEHPKYISTLQALSLVYNDLGVLYIESGDYDAAAPLLKQAVEIRCRVLGEENTAVATSLDNLGILYLKKADYDAAESLLKRALEIRCKVLGKNDPDSISSLNNLGEMYRESGNYTAAERFLKESVDLGRQVFGETHINFATSLHNLALLYQNTGNDTAAEPLYEQVLKIRLKVLGKEHPAVTTSLNCLGVLYMNRGNYEKAEEFLEEALKIRRKILGEEHPDVATSMNNLAQLYRKLSCYTDAEPLYKQAIEIERRNLGETHPQLATSLHNLALLYYQMGNYTSAEPLFQQALKIDRDTLGEDHLLYAQDLRGLAQLYTATKRETEAIKLLQKAETINDHVLVQIFSVGSEQQRMAYLKNILNDFNIFISLTLEHLSQSPEAVGAALDLVLRRKAIGAEALAAQNTAMMENRFPHLKMKLQEQITLRSKIAQKTLAGSDSDIISHLQLLKEWKSQLEKLETELSSQIPEMSLAQKFLRVDRQAIAAALPEGSALVEYLSLYSRDFKAVLKYGIPQWQPTHYVAFVMLAKQPDKVHMIDLGLAGSIDQMIAEFRASITGEAEARETRHLGDWTSLSGLEITHHLGDTLRAKVFDPLLPALDGCKRLFFSPDGNLTRLPFEILPTQDCHYLIDEYYISYLSAGRDILRLNVKTTIQPTAPIVAADPDFNLNAVTAAASINTDDSEQKLRTLRKNDLHFNPLPGTHTEGERIAALLGIKPLLGDKVLASQLQACQSPRILHLATHGFFLPDPAFSFREKIDFDSIPIISPLSPQPVPVDIIDVKDDQARVTTLWQGIKEPYLLENPMLRSGLALAGANTWLEGGNLPAEAEDGLLTAEDVVGLHLLATELVVLSACETGLGELQASEGIFGLRRAFVVAGAKTLVMSLWKVPDRQTQELMEEFYKRILSGLSRADALREAQLAMKSKYPHPLYWGAFICQGDPRPLSHVSSIK